QLEVQARAARRPELVVGARAPPADAGHQQPRAADLVGDLEVLDEQRQKLRARPIARPLHDAPRADLQALALGTLGVLALHARVEVDPLRARVAVRKTIIRRELRLHGRELRLHAELMAAIVIAAVVAAEA